MYFVRTAGERDLEKVRALLVESFHATYDSLHGKAKVADLIAHLFSPAALKTRLVRKDAEFLVADDGRNIGGMGYAAMSQQLTKTVMLHLLYVRPRCSAKVSAAISSPSSKPAFPMPRSCASKSNRKTLPRSPSIARTASPRSAATRIAEPDNPAFRR